MRATPLQAIRISTLNLAAVRHFWESAFGFRFAGECEVHDALLRKLWDTEGGTMRVARLDLPAHPFPRLELFQWEGCAGQPIRDARRPWDTGVREICIPVHLEARARLRGHLERLQCRFLDDSVFVNPFGERCRIGMTACVSLTVPELNEAQQFFGGFLGWNCVAGNQDAAIAGAASVSKGESLLFSPVRSDGFSQVEAGRFQRIADPRESMATADRMSPRHTGVWMLTASVDRLPEGDPRIVDCDIPFVGRSRAIVGRAPGGVRFGVFEGVS